MSKPVPSCPWEKVQPFTAEGLLSALSILSKEKVRFAMFAFVMEDQPHPDPSRQHRFVGVAGRIKRDDLKYLLLELTDSVLEVMAKNEKK